MGVMTYDAIKDANQLTDKAESYLKTQSITRGFTVDALDLSLIDKQVSDFECYNSYPVINPVMGLNEYLRVIDQTIDIVSPQNAQLGFGNKFKKASDYTLDNLNTAKDAKKLKNTVNILSTATIQATKLSNDAIIAAQSAKETATKLETDLNNADLAGVKTDITTIKNQQDTIIANLGEMAQSMIDLQAFKTNQLEINTSQTETNTAQKAINEAQATTNKDFEQRIAALEGGSTSGE